LGTRTSIVETGSGRVRLNKFAPMGSALCFPIQSILFSSIVLLAYLKHYYGARPSDNPSKDWPMLHCIDRFIKSMHNKPEELLSEYLCPRVYGDDIISDYRITDHVLILLEQCGLRVNSEKSFIGGTPFRESCGIFAYNGEDVTPYLFRLPGFVRKLGPKQVASICDLANRAGDFQYHHLRSVFIRTLKHSSVVGMRGDITPYIPFTMDREQFGIYTTNPHRPVVVRMNRDYQREEKRVLCIRSVHGRGKVAANMEDYAYDQWMRARIRGGSDEINFSSSRVRPSVTRIRLGWTPV